MELKRITHAENVRLSDSGRAVRILDQSRLPNETVYLELSQAVVGGGAGLLQDAKGVDQVRGHLLLSNGKVFKAPLGLGSPEFVRGNRDFTHGVMFYPLFQGGFLLFKRWGFLGRRPCGALPGPMDLLKNISKRMIADDDARPGIKDQGGGVDQDQLVSLVGLHQVGDGKLF